MHVEETSAVADDDEVMFGTRNDDRQPAVECVDKRRDARLALGIPADTKSVGAEKSNHWLGVCSISVLFGKSFDSGMGDINSMILCNHAGRAEAAAVSVHLHPTGDIE